MNGVSVDGRSKGMLQYHMTPTGRWGGRRFQPQNIVRPKLEDIDTLLGLLSTGDTKLFTMFYDNPLQAVGDSIRSLVKAQKGHRMMAGDFANIEGRVAAWYAGEEWKLEAFRKYDTILPGFNAKGEPNRAGPDLYILAYSKTFGVSIIEVTKHERQIGKVMELSLQYQGGHGAFVQMAPTYGVDVNKLAPIVKENVDAETWDKAFKKYRVQNAFGLHPDTWTAIRIIIDGWRAGHPNIKQAWYDLEEAAKNAVESPGAIYSVGPVKFRKNGSFLFMQLPSGKAVVFPYPCIKEKKMPWTETRQHRNRFGEIEEAEFDVYKPCLCYKAIDDHSQWSDAYAYGGQLFNYVVQGTARDILVESMFALEAAGYPIVLTVHDEDVSEVPHGHGSLAEFKEIMARVPDFVKGCPIAVDGWEGERYRKA
jgi:DNA polymerase